MNSDPKKRRSAGLVPVKNSPLIDHSLKPRFSFFGKRLSVIPEEIKVDTEKSMKFKEILNETSVKDSFYFKTEIMVQTECHKGVKKFWNFGIKNPKIKINILMSNNEYQPTPTETNFFKAIFLLTD